MMPSSTISGSYPVPVSTEIRVRIGAIHTNKIDSRRAEIKEQGKDN